jgi:HK97 family phage prohead protease
MIVKTVLKKDLASPSTMDEAQLALHRKSVLSKMKGKVSEKTLDKLKEKLLTPQKWHGTFAFKAMSTPTTINAEDEMIIEGLANAADPDRAREIITASAWNTDNFDLNPIILFNHCHDKPIGSCLEYKVEDNGLSYRASIGKPSAYPMLTETQHEVRSLLAQGILRTNSVGFIPVDLDYDEEADLIRYTNVELLEISVVSIPMQQGSVIDNVGSAAKNIKNIKGDIKMDKEQFDLLVSKIDALASKVDAMKPVVEDGCKPDEEEMKALKEKVKCLETKLEETVKEKEEIEKEAEALVDSLEKNGIEIKE